MKMLLTLVAAPALAAGAFITFQDPKNPILDMTPEQMQEGWKRYAEVCKPGKNHKFFNQFLGSWKVTTRMFTPGAPPMESEGSAEYSWLYEGRWMKSEMKGTMMGRPLQSIQIMGYDNYKNKFVFTTVDNMTTNIRPAEGSLDQSAKNIFFYGPLDEPITGEHDKPVKYALRLKDEDHHVLEVHDLTIGEKNTKVLEFVFERVKK